MRHAHPAAPGRVAGLISLFVVLAFVTATAASAAGRTYTLDGDFDLGTMINVNHDAPGNDQLQLNTITEPFPFIWVACSNLGTAVRIDVDTGAILGEYRTAPEGMNLNPSRTTVDLYGNVWIGNRNEADDDLGSVVKIALVIGGTRGDKNPDGSFTPNVNGQYLAPPFLYNTAVDRDGDGYIKTSRGVGDVLSWPNITDGAGGPTGIVEDADDESIVLYQRTNCRNVRHVTVDSNNDLWVGGYRGTADGLDLLDGDTAAILTTLANDCGGYGGLIDGNNVLWSAAISQSLLLRYDLNTNIQTCIPVGYSYGLGIDSGGYIWNAMWTNNTIMKLDPLGNIVAGFPKPTGGNASRGVAVTPLDDHVWVANSNSGTVSRLDNNGNLITTVPVGLTPTGVAVDANGKVWVTNYDSDDARRIDPATNAVDLTVNLSPGAGPYNYSDMTGIIVAGATAPQGTWDVVYDSALPGIEWGTASWNSFEPLGTGVGVRVRAADTPAGLGSQPWLDVTNGIGFAGVFGRFIEVQAILSRDVNVDETPILYDISIQVRQIDVALDLHPTSCPNPLNVKSKGKVPAAILGTDLVDVMNIDPATILLEGVAPLRWNYEDVATPVVMGEPCECNSLLGDGYMDMTLKFKTQELVAALGEVDYRELVPMTLTGALLDGTPIAGVDCMIIVGANEIDMWDSRAEDGDKPDLDPWISVDGWVQDPVQKVTVGVNEDGVIRVTVFDVTGRLVREVTDEWATAGEHQFDWNVEGLHSGIYFYRLETPQAVVTQKVTILRR